MAPPRKSKTALERVFDAPDATLLDVIDELLNKGVMVTGDVTLGVAGIDLIYLRLSSILCAVDRVVPREGQAPTKPVRRRRRSRTRS
jgi:hypothetical protein